MTTITGPTGINATRPRPRSLLLRLLRGEWRKVTTTNTWWLFAIAMVPTTGLGLLLSIGTTDDALHHGGKGAPPDGYADVTQAPAHLVATFAADIFTSGQFFGGMFATLMAVLLITNEYRHQTATTTFLALWGIFGLGVGVLLRSQLAATVLTVLLYTIGGYGALAVVALIRTYVYRHDSVNAWIVLYPPYAAQIAADPNSKNLPDGTHVWWVGALVMVAYGVTMATLGTMILRKHDIF